MRIRVAESDDAEEIARIYARYVPTRVTFECDAPDAPEFRRRIAGTIATHPCLVEEAKDGALVGYAYAHRFQARAAHQWGAELSIYLAPERIGRGLGRPLCECLIELLKAQGVRAVYACVTAPNPPSEAFHAKLGFRKVAHFPHAGFKNGAWRDVVWLAKDVAPFDAPSPLIPFPELPPAIVRNALEAFSVPHE